MLQRRRFLGALACTTGMASGAWAQRPAQPIARPPGQRLAGAALIRGRFNAEGGVSGGALPGVYVVVGVDAGSDTLQLRDDGGRTGTVHVADHTFDLASVKAGDEVEVDFAVPQPGSTRLEAGGVWKVQR